MTNSKSRSAAPAGYRFPREVIGVAVRLCLRYGLSYRDLEELLAERGIEVDHVPIYRPPNGVDHPAVEAHQVISRARVA